MNFFIILEMEEELNILQRIQKNSGSKGSTKSLSTVELTDPDYDRFKDPFGANGERRELQIKDTLLNEKNFINYWKSREKHRDPTILAHQIKYGKIDDVDNDGFNEYVAYYNDGSKDNIIGYNQYVLGPPISTQKKTKAAYYQKSASDRQKESYSDYLSDHVNDLDGWVSAEAIKKYKEAQEKKLVTKVKKFFTQNAGFYATLNAKEKTAAANLFIKIAAEAMIANNANPVQASVVKSLPGFVEEKKKFIEETLLKDADVKNQSSSIIQAMVLGHIQSIEAYLEKLATDAKVILTAANITDLYKYAMQTKYMRGLAKTEYSSANDAAFTTWHKNKYGGHDILTAAPRDFLSQ